MEHFVFKLFLINSFCILYLLGFDSKNFWNVSLHFKSLYGDQPAFSEG